LTFYTPFPSVSEREPWYSLHRQHNKGSKLSNSDKYNLHTQIN